MLRALRLSTAWVTLTTMMAPLCGALWGCASETRERVESSTAALTYSSGFQAPDALPEFTYTAPLEPDRAEIVRKPFAPLSTGPNGESAGGLNGSGSVDFDGSFNYVIPLRLPEGVNGMKPNLAIGYGSRDPESSLGVGFALRGLSKIERCKKVLAVEQEVRQVNYDGQDSFCIDGKKMMLTGGTSGQVGASYRAEVADYREIKIESIVDGAPKFTVYTGSGEVRTYLAQPDLVRERRTNVVTQTNVSLVWNLSTVRDHLGYGYDVGYRTYFAPNGLRSEQVVGSISYANASRSLRFVYDSVDDNRVLRCVSGVCFARPPRLRKIEVVVNSRTGESGVQWEYRFDYETSLKSGLARLAKMTWCGASGECLTPTRFSWSTPTDEHPEWNDEYTLYDVSAPFKVDNMFPPEIRVADVNGDGRGDVLYNKTSLTQNACNIGEIGNIGAQRQWLSLSQGLGAYEETNSLGVSHDLLGTPTDISSLFASDAEYPGFYPARSRYADIDGDGAVEVFAFVALSWANLGTFRLLDWDRNQGKLVRAPASSGWSNVANLFSLPNRPLHIGDANGDGLVDLFRGAPAASGEAATDWSVHLTQAQTGGAVIGASSISIENAVSNCQDAFRLSDLDADGRMGGECAPAAFGLSPLDSYQYELLPGFAKYTYGDVNGDGVEDVVSVYGAEVSVQIGTGQGFRPTISRSFPVLLGRSSEATQVYSVEDVNGDGKADFVTRGKSTSNRACGIEIVEGTPIILVSDGENFREWTGAFSYQLDGYISHATGDIDGNGTPEFLVVTHDSTTDSFFIETYVLKAFGSGGLPRAVHRDVLTAVNEAGAYENIEYITMTRLDPVTDENDPYRPSENCVWPQKCSKSGLVVVRRYDGKGTGYRKWRYRYEDGRSDVAGRGFLGFKCVTREDEYFSGEVVKTCFDNETRMAKACPGWIYPYAKKPKSVEVRTPIDSLGKIRVTRTDYSWKPPRWMNHAVYAVELDSMTQKTYEGPRQSSDLVFAAKVHRDSDLVRQVNESFTVDSVGNVVQHHTTSIGNGETSNQSIFRNFNTQGFPYYRTNLLSHEEVQRSGKGENLRKHTFDYTYNSKGFLTQRIIQMAGGDDQKATVTFNRDPLTGLVQGIEHVAANVPRATTRIYFDEDDVHIRRIINPVGHSAFWVMHPALGLPLTQIDANGVRTDTTYDFVGRPRFVDKAGSGDSTIQYWKDGPNTGVSVNGGDGSFATAEYDFRSRPLTVEKRLVDGRMLGQGGHYDDLSNFLKSSTEYTDDLTTARTTKFDRDLLGRVTKTTAPDETFESAVYSFYSTTHTDPVGRVTKSVRDVDGLTKSNSEFNGSTEVKTSFEYYPFGEVKSTKFSSGSKISFEIDELGRRTKTTDPDGGVSYQWYDARGLVRKSQRGGRPEDNYNLYYTTTNAYDLLGRLTSSTTACLTGADCRNEEKRFTWDAAPYAAGQLVRAENVTDGIATTNFFNSRGQKVREETFLDGSVYELKFAYNSASQLVRLDYPETPGRSRFFTNYHWDSEGSVDRVFSNDTTFWEVVDRANDGQVGEILQQFSGGASVHRDFAYDDVTGRLFQTSSQTTPVGGSRKGLQTFTHRYWEDGLLKRSSGFDRVLFPGSTSADEVHEYTYDFAARVESWTRSGTDSWTYGYSNDGNLTSATKKSSSGTVLYDESYGTGASGAGPHTTTSIGSPVGATLYNYDKAGRLKERNVFGDTNLRLWLTDADLPYRTEHKATDGSTVVTGYRYDAFGNRVVKATSKESTVTLGGIYEEVSSLAPLTPATKHTFRVYAGGEIVAQETFDEVAITSDRTFIHADRLGSPSVVINADGTVRGKLWFDPWGKRITKEGLAETGSPGGPLRSGFTGHEHDDELGLINMRGRLYDPRLRRMLSPDPVASSSSNSGIHPYAYVMNNPVNLTDPSGFYSCDPGVQCETLVVDANAPDYDDPDFVPSSGAGGTPAGAAKASPIGGGATSGTSMTGRPPQGPSGPMEGPRPAPSIFSTVASLFVNGGERGGTEGPPTFAGVSDGNRTGNSAQNSFLGFLNDFSLDDAHTLLGVAGFVPGLGEVADGLDVALYVYEGKYADAAMSAIGLVPFAGNSMKAGMNAGGGLKSLATFSKSTIESVVSSSGRIVGQTTAGAQAIAKKIGHAASRGDTSAFKGLAATQKNAESVIRNVLSNPTTTAFGRKTIDAYNAVGQGVRFTVSGAFQGFIEGARRSR